MPIHLQPRPRNQTTRKWPPRRLLPSLWNGLTHEIGAHGGAIMRMAIKPLRTSYLRLEHSKNKRSRCAVLRREQIQPLLMMLGARPSLFPRSLRQMSQLNVRSWISKLHSMTWRCCWPIAHLGADSRQWRQTTPPSGIRILTSSTIWCFNSHRASSNG